MKIKIVGFDPSMSNWGTVQALVDLDTLSVQILNMQLSHTESEKNKGVRKDSDDLRRAKVVHEGMVKCCEGMVLAISEIPFCNPGGYASANFNSGLVTGVLATCPIPLIQVFPQDVKMLACGSRSAAKEEMTEWAMEKHPDARWLTRKLKGKMVPTAANEHLADAVAVIYAGLQTEEFKRIRAMYLSMTGTLAA